MVLRKQSIRERLKRLEEILATLSRKAHIPLDTYRQDVETQWVIERGLELGSAIILDIGNHILAGAYAMCVDEHGQVTEGLGAQGVISEELYKELRGLGGFRNPLVHGYLRLNPDIVYAHFQKALRVFPRFIAEIEAWLEAYQET